MTLNKPSGFAVNDVIDINTVIGAPRSIKLNGVDVMALLSADSKWIDLSAVNSVLSTYGTAPGDGRTVITHYGYRASWWGI
jgi:hypothetical protein